MTNHQRRRPTAKNNLKSKSDGRGLVSGILFFLTEVIVISGAYSPFRLPKMALALVGLAVLAGSWSAFRLWHGRLEIPISPLVKVLVALPVLQALSAIWAQAPVLALQKAFVSSIWVAAALWFSSFETEERRRVLQWGVWGAVISGVVLLGQLSNFDRVAVRGVGSGDRLTLTGLAGNPSDLAMAALLFLPLLLPKALAQPKKWNRWLLPGFLAVTAALTQALTGLVAIGLMGLGCVALMRSKKAWGLALIVSAVAALAISASPLRSRIQAEWVQLRQGNWYNLLSARQDGWTAALTMIEHSPILGVGAGQFSREFYPAREIWLDQRQAVGRRGELATHFEWAHNDPLQLTSELGLIGVVWMVFFIAALARSGPPGDPVIVLSALVWAPFLCLHYPTHLAIGLFPGVLVLAHRLKDAPRRSVLADSSFTRRAVAVAIAAVAVSVCLSQAAGFRLNRWRGYTEALFTVAESAPAAKRNQIVHKIENEAGGRIARYKSSAPWLWRIIGRARLLSGAFEEAEASFRRSLALGPHEEAEMGLGLALAGQGRSAEAVHHLTRACRVNPTLVAFISQKDLRESVRSSLRLKNTKTE
ncbi:MAG: O-antigen ligase family protein [Acidobacteriota bacterium]